MKKTATTIRTADRKLRLDRETVRQLATESLEQARGGAVETVVRHTDACPVGTTG
jgi:hypothetical protein